MREGKMARHDRLKRMELLGGLGGAILGGALALHLGLGIL
jgi:hypothetical protein